MHWPYDVGISVTGRGTDPSIGKPQISIRCRFVNLIPLIPILRLRRLGDALRRYVIAQSGCIHCKDVASNGAKLTTDRLLQVMREINASRL